MFTLRTGKPARFDRWGVEMLAVSHRTLVCAVALVMALLAFAVPANAGNRLRDWRAAPTPEVAAAFADGTANTPTSP